MPAACSTASNRFAQRITTHEAPTQSPAQLLAPGRALTFANVAEGAEGLVISDLARAVAARPKPPAVSLAVVCRDGPRMQQLARALEFFAPDLPVCSFRPGTASPMTGCRRMAASWRSG
jgi:transcription-repair coupling factor (superfamily II helicase)